MINVMTLLLLLQTAVVSRDVNLRAGPSTSYKVKETLHPNDELLLLDPNETHGYYNVRAADGEEGWVWGHNIQITDAPAPPPPAPPNTIPELFHGCSLDGTATTQHRQQSNEQKNRRTAPASGDIESTATLAAMLAPGDDQSRWNEARGASIAGYVANVKLGSSETVNCGSTDSAYMDTHIELVQDPADTQNKVKMIVEVTPRWRWFMAQQGVDWSTRALKQTLQGHWVRFTGWLFWDFEHAHNAENTHPGDPSDWRATAWEIHPVTAITICAGSPAEDPSCQ